MFYNKYLKYKMKYHQLKYNDDIHPKQNGGSSFTDEPREEHVIDDSTTIYYNPNDDSYTVNSINYKIRLYSNIQPLIIGDESKKIQFEKYMVLQGIIVPALMRHYIHNFCIIQNNGMCKSYFMFYNKPVVSNINIEDPDEYDNTEHYATKHTIKQIQQNDSDECFTYDHNDKNYDHKLLYFGSVDENIDNYIRNFNIFLTISKILILQVDRFKLKNPKWYKTFLGILCENINHYNECLYSIFNGLPYKPTLLFTNDDEKLAHDKRVSQLNMYEILIDISTEPIDRAATIIDNVDYKLQTYKSSGNTYRPLDKLTDQSLCIKQKPDFLQYGA